MTNYYFNKNIACVFVLMLTVSLFSFGCSSTKSWQKRTMVSYQAAGEILNTSKPILMAMCADGTLGDADCKEARHAYNEAVSLYKLLGTTAVMAIDIDDPGSYETMQAQLRDLLTLLADYTGRR